MIALAQDVGWVLAYALGCVSLGAGLAAAARVRLGEGFEGASLAFLLGLVGYGSIWLGLGLAGRFSTGWIVAVWLLGTVCGARSLLARLRADTTRSPGWLAAGPLGWAIAAALGVLLLALALAALGPPIGDAVAFYMALAKALAAGEQLVPLPGYDRFTQIGLHGELHLAALLSVGREPAAKLLPWFVALAAGGVLAGIARACGIGARGRWIAWIVLFSSSAFTYVIVDGKVDLFAAAFGLAAVFCALRLDEDTGPGNTFLCGVFTGIAAVAKFSYLAALLPTVALVALLARVSEPAALWRQPRRWLGAAAGIGAGFLLAWVPHLAKNGLLFGEPLAPFLGAALQSRSQDLGGSWLDQSWHSADLMRRILLQYPISLTFGRYPMQYGNLSALMLALAPLVFVVARGAGASRRLRTVSWAAAAGLVAFTLVRPGVFAPRYVLANLLLLVPLAAYAGELATSSRAPRGLRRGVALALLATLLSAGFGAEGAAAWARRGWAHARGTAPLDADQALAAHLNGEAPEGARILFGHWYRYWLRSDLLQCASSEAEFASLADSSPAETWARLHDRGFVYVVAGPGFGYLDAEGEAHPFGPEQVPPEAAPPWLAVKEVFRDDARVVYRLTAHVEAPAPRVACDRSGAGFRAGPAAAPEGRRGDR